MNVIFSVAFTGTPDADDALAARHAVFLENREINARNSVLASQTPPGTALPLLPTSTPAELKASYLATLAKRVTARHIDFTKDAKSAAGIETRFTAGQLETIRANLTARLNAGALAQDIVNDTAS